MRSVKFQFERFSMVELSDSSPVKVAEYFSRNKLHLKESMPAREVSFYTEEFWARAVSRYQSDSDSGVIDEFRWFLHGNHNEVIGHVSFDKIVKGAFQSCYLGYGIDVDFQGQGLMRQALQRTLKFVFKDFGLNRVMANYEPGNTRSAYLLRSLGFEQEGYARRYLKLNGRWRDHVLSSLIAEDYFSRG